MRTKLLTILTAVALCATSGLAEASATTVKAKHSHPVASSSLPAKAKAYGRYCSTESKKHVSGTPGTPFSKCVTDMAKLANGTSKSARAACSNESKRHVAGTPGTPYSRCVSGARSMGKAHG